MTLDLEALLADLGKASMRTKVAALLALAILVAGITMASLFSAKPHYVLLYSDLDDVERVAVEKAMAGGKVSYRVSAPPAPFSIYVDEEQFDVAQIQVALAEALKRSPVGINSSSSGSSTIFMSSGERAQAMLKREWQETERLLEQLEFVSRATVTSSLSEPSPLRKPAPPTVSVALQVKGGNALGAEQARTVGKLVRFRFGVPAENVVITDQAGHILFDESERNTGQLAGLQPLEHASKFNAETAERVNSYLAATYGADKVRVSVSSEWDFDHQTVISETLDGESKESSITKTESRTPQEEGPTAAPAAGQANAVATNKEETTQYEVPRQRLQTVRTAPLLKRLFVSLALDQTLAARKAEVQSLVEAAVGFDNLRQDVIGITTTDFAAFAKREGADAGAATTEGAGEAGAAGDGDGGSGGMNEMLKRGVEIVSALGFVAVLFMSLKKGGATRSSEATAGSPAGADVGIDTAELARARIDELVRSDPRRVGEILSRWASEETAATKS